MSRRATSSVPALPAAVGSLTLRHPVMTASGTAGHGAELGSFFPLRELGALVVKSLSAEPWVGNPAPRVHPTGAGMLNSVGLQGRGVSFWRNEELPELRDSGAAVVVSIWGRTVEEFTRAAELLADLGPEVVAVEVNVSCPNLEDRNRIFAHDPDMTEAVVAATAVCNRPRWAKLSPNTDRIVEIADAARRGGAEAVTLINTVVGMAIDVETRRPVLGAQRGGLSGRAVHPVAVRACFDVHQALPDLPIVGVGGVAEAVDAVELLLAGASAVQVGTASFADPRAAHRVAAGLSQWCRNHGVASVRELVGAAHR